MARNNLSTVGFLYIPFVIINLAVALLYSITNFFVLQRIPRFTEASSTFVLPIILMGLTLTVFYRPVIRVVPRFRGEEFRALTLVFILSVPFVIILQTAIAQLSLVPHTITEQGVISQTSGKHLFTITGGVTLNGSATGSYSTVYRTHNKNAPDNVNFEVYRVSKITSPKGSNSALWYGMLYSDVSKRDRSTQEFLYEKLERLEKTSADDFNQLINGERITEVELNTQSSKYGNFEKAVKNSGSSGDNIVVLVDKEKRGSVGWKVKISVIVFIGCQAVWLLFCYLARASKHEIEHITKLTSAQRRTLLRKELGESFEYLIPRKDYFLTPIIINLNIIIFSLMYFGKADDASAPISWGSNYSPLVWRGQFWRLFTSGFIHFDFPHLIGNMVALGFSGFMLEKVLGSKRFGVLYFFSILGASMTSLTFHDVVNGAGASGGVLGLLGAMLIYAIFDIGDQDNRIMFVGVFVIFGFFTLIMGFTGYSSVDNAGHIGGLITGMITGLFFIPVVRNAKSIMP